MGIGGGVLFISNADVEDVEVDQQTAADTTIDDSESLRPLTESSASSASEDESVDKVSAERSNVVTGLVVLSPIILSLFVASWILSQMSLLPGEHLLNLTSIYFVNQFLKLSVLIVAGIVIADLTGRAIKTNGGPQIRKSLDNIFFQIPVIGAVYRMTKVTAETMTGTDGELRKPVKISLNGMRVTAFKTGNKTCDGRELLFLPTAPNITTGMILEVEPEEVIDPGETSEQALTRILSAGFGQHSDNK